MDSYPFSAHSNFVELLSQQTIPFGNNEDSGDLSSSQPLPESSQATENKRTPGVKAAKKACQKTVVSDGDLKKFQSMWTMRQADLDRKERLSQLSLLNSLIGKKEPLPEYEETLKKKPINDLCSVSCSKLMFLFNVLVSEMML
ncbi:hypothetical protein F2Q68_00041781 [Brassica cretica]|uniref:No apical meristem-associated C-terminal domain-containing protein n=1 Tax=Brassica cretica TaxID=69181 RepID=A0A8S9MNG1_BRACR|nr:hypothetical protein F2Q68_00041781 [Brassica cretica]